MKIAVLILAGGSGLRLWPLSRKEKPKQFLHISDSDSSFFEMTVSRALKITDANNVFVLTQKSYIDQVKEKCSVISAYNIFCEPQKKNTGPAIATALMKIQKRVGDVVTVVMPSDHYIFDEKSFVSTISEAVSYCQEHNEIVTIGIPPVRPDTSFGYIRCAEEISGGFYKTSRFVEKPDLEMAKCFSEDKTYFWNSGIFVCKASAMSDLFLVHLPEVFDKARAIANTGDIEEEHRIYESMPSISIDYGVLEKTDKIVLLKGCFGWDDIGSWPAMERLYNKDFAGNICSKDDIILNSSNCTVISRNARTFVVGAENILVINTGDITLICQKDHIDQLSEIPNLISEKDLNMLL